ncbi:MAG: 2-amino-4-hydroxy-6-hydroxymethyldihydropteridine diphosphokinase [Terriglobia bacterium]
MGDRENWLRKALSALDVPDLRLSRVSSLYETEPMGLREQAWFLNLAAEFETGLFPLQLLHRIQQTELRLGRKRSVRNGPRTIDIDILLYQEAIVKTKDLEIPHARLAERRFVLEPLAELNPALQDPVSGRSVSQLLQQVRDQTVRRLPDRL